MGRIEPSGGAADLRDHGRLAVLNAIRLAGRIARIDISRAVGLSPATVTAITAEMIAAGVLEEIRQEEKPSQSRRGRPRVLLKLRGGAHRVAGVKVAQRYISVLILDFEGREIIRHQMSLARAKMQSVELVDQVTLAVEQACGKGGFRPDDLSGIGIGLAGQIDAIRNFVHWSSSLIHRNADLASVLAQRLPVPAFLDNDANLVAKAEHLFGAVRNVNNFLVVTIEHGVGLGIILDGELYRGARGCGAELGHTKVQYEGALCQCGQRGCLEAYVGGYAMLREANVEIAGSNIQGDISDFLAAAQAGNQTALSVLERAGRILAMGIANLINVFDPELIILAGARVSFRHFYERNVMPEMQRMVVQVDAPLPEIRVHEWGDEMWAKGAAAYAIEQVSVLTVRELAKDAV
ncbi:ROK family protein [Amaricoccus macauensis]|uniref:ROK family protein n=1 Tax=Amaricoccus macauensis TaxID=57001 RepID=UPI003C7C7949